MPRPIGAEIWVLLCRTEVFGEDLAWGATPMGALELSLTVLGCPLPPLPVPSRCPAGAGGAILGEWSFSAAILQSDNLFWIDLEAEVKNPEISQGGGGTSYFLSLPGGGGTVGYLWSGVRGGLDISLVHGRWTCRDPTPRRGCVLCGQSCPGPSPVQPEATFWVPPARTHLPISPPLLSCLSPLTPMLGPSQLVPLHVSRSAGAVTGLTAWRCPTAGRCWTISPPKALGRGTPVSPVSWGVTGSCHLPPPAPYAQNQESRLRSILTWTRVPAPAAGCPGGRNLSLPTGAHGLALAIKGWGQPCPDGSPEAIVSAGFGAQQSHSCCAGDCV